MLGGNTLIQKNAGTVLTVPASITPACPAGSYQLSLLRVS